MAKDMKGLKDLFLDELRDIYDAEKQLTKALPKMAKKATAEPLRSAFEAHLEETKGHVERLEQAFDMLEEKARGKHCAGIGGIIEEAKELMEEDFDESTMDAGLIAGGQRAEHYEITAYGSVIEWAKTLGHEDVASLLHETLEEEKAADEKLTQIAEGGVNADAAGEDAKGGVTKAQAGVVGRSKSASGARVSPVRH